MILLPTQLQSLAYMTLMGWVYGLMYSFMNRFFYRLRRYKIVMYGIEIVFHIFYMSLLYYGLFQINFGILNLYLWLAFFLGLYFYLRLYSTLFQRVFERFMHLLSFLLRPFKIAYLKIFAIIKELKERRRKKKHARKQRRKEEKEKKRKKQ